MLHLLSLGQIVSPISVEDPKILISMVLGFLLLLFVVLRLPIPYLSVPHYRGVLNERAGRISTNKQQVDIAIADVQQLRNDYAERLEKIEIEARERIDAAVREADAARAEIIAEAEQLAQAIRRRSEEEIARERTRQRILFRQQLVKSALDSAEGAIRENSDPNIQHRLIGDFIVLASRADATQSSAQGGA